MTEGFVKLNDGRKLSWRAWGYDHGIPIIFCTGAAMSSSLPFGIRALNEMRLRLIVIDRPGLGDSDKHAEKTLQTWSDDVKALIADCKLESPRALGFSQGSAFALALAAAGVVKKVALVSGQDEFSKPEVFSKLPTEVADFVDRFRTRDQSFIEGFSKVASAEGLWSLVTSTSSEKDRVFYESEPFQASYRKSLQEGFSQGPEGYLRDLEITFGKWPFELEKMSVPVDLWYGALDASTVHSPDYGLTLSERLPNSRHFLLPDEGGSLLWTQAERILKELIQ